jgi:TPR repeat protein
MDFKSDDIELYAIVLLMIFLWWFIKNTIKFYHGEKKRVKHLHRFAKDGEVESQVELGEHYQKGKVVKKSCDRAAYWYNRAALSGDDEAKGYLEKFMQKRKGKKKC